MDSKLNTLEDCVRNGRYIFILFANSKERPFIPVRAL